MKVGQMAQGHCSVIWNHARFDESKPWSYFTFIYGFPEVYTEPWHNPENQNPEKANKRAIKSSTHHKIEYIYNIKSTLLKEIMKNT